jgi:lipopolysaccharide biosynthesis glycosyltransferase
MLTIFGVSDGSYLKFIRVLFNSIKENVKIPYRFHLHAINVIEDEIDKLIIEYPGITFTHDNIVLDDTPNKRSSFGKSQKASYCANIRAKTLYDLLLRGDEYILYLDADSIVIRDLANLLELIKQNDLIIFRRDKEADPRLKVLTSVIGINNNNKSITFIEAWKNCMMRDRVLYTWFSDQVYFHKTMVKNPHVKIGYLPIEYVDSGFNSKSYIWNGKAKRKHTDKTYIKAMEKYK